MGEGQGEGINSDGRGEGQGEVRVLPSLAIGYWMSNVSPFMESALEHPCARADLKKRLANL
jgi:hypothetical protein